MKILYLLRHAKSSREAPGLSDFERPLSGRGKRACEAISEMIRARKITPQVVLCSSAARTEDTLRRIAPALPKGRRDVVERQLYLASAAKLLARLHKLPADIDSVMVIGHNPGLHRLALSLTRSGDGAALERLRAKFPTAALAILEIAAADWSSLDAGGAKLAGFWAPREAEPDAE